MQKVRKAVVVALLISTVMAMSASSALACSGVLCWLIGEWDLGVTDRAKISADKAVDLERIRQDGLAEIEKARQAGEVSEAEANSAARRFEAEMEMLRSVATTNSTETFETMRTGILEQSQVAQRGIEEAGKTERTRLLTDAGQNALWIIGGIVVVIWLLGGRKQPQIVVVEKPTYLPGEQGHWRPVATSRRQHLPAGFSVQVQKKAEIVHDGGWQDGY